MFNLYGVVLEDLSVVAESKAEAESAIARRRKLGDAVFFVDKIELAPEQARRVATLAGAIEKAAKFGTWGKVAAVAAGMEPGLMRLAAVRAGDVLQSPRMGVFSV